METPIEQAIKWCDEHIKYRSRSTKSQQEKEIYVKVKEKLESLLPIEKQFAEYNQNVGKGTKSGS